MKKAVWKMLLLCRHLVVGLTTHPGYSALEPGKTDMREPQSQMWKSLLPGAPREEGRRNGEPGK